MWLEVVREGCRHSGTESTFETAFFCASVVTSLSFSRYLLLLTAKQGLKPIH